MDEARVDVGTADVLPQKLCHRRRPADVDLPFGDVGDELLEMSRRQQSRTVFAGVVTDHEVEGDPSLARQLLELVAEDHVFVPDDAIDHDNVSRHVLHQGANRRDPDAARDQDDLVAAPRLFREDPEGTLSGDACAGSDLREPAREVAERLDRDPKRAAVRRLRQREGVRSPPALPVQETPEEELAGPCVEPVQAASRDSERDDARALGDDFRDAQAVAQRAQGRTDDPEGEEQAERAEVQRAPVIGRDPIEHELVAGRDLVNHASAMPA